MRGMASCCSQAFNNLRPMPRRRKSGWTPIEAIQPRLSRRRRSPITNPIGQSSDTALRRTISGNVSAAKQSIQGQASRPKQAFSKEMKAERSRQVACSMSTPDRVVVSSPSVVYFSLPERKFSSKLVNSIGKINLVAGLVPMIFKVSKYCKVIVF
jgi:hypothetical protein